MSILSFMKTNLNMIFESCVPHSVVLNSRTIEILMFKSCQTPSSQPIQSIIRGKNRIHSISKWAALMWAVNGDFRPAFGSVHMSLPLFFHATSYCLLTCSGLSVWLHHAHYHNLGERSPLVFSVGGFLLFTFTKRIPSKNPSLFKPS